MGNCDCSCHGAGPYADHVVVLPDGTVISPCILCAGIHYDALNSRLALGEEALELLSKVLEHQDYDDDGTMMGSIPDDLWLRIQALLKRRDGK